MPLAHASGHCGPALIGWAHGSSLTAKHTRLWTVRWPRSRQQSSGAHAIGQGVRIDCQDETSCLNGSSCDPPHKMYFASYWACVTITSVGYGDTSASCNPSLRFLCSLLVLAGGLLWASLVGTFAALATNITPEKRKYRTRLALLGSFMTTSDLPQKMRFRLREYLKESMHLYRTPGQEIMGSLSPALQGEVALEVHGMWLDNIWFVEDAPTMLKIELAAMLEPKIIRKANNRLPASSTFSSVEWHYTVARS